MKLRKIYTSKIFVPIAILIVVLLVLGFYWLHVLDVAHRSFENYYNFRGCVQLIERTDTYGICKISSGEKIKIVKFQDKWYLNGDLPYQGFNFL